MDSVELEILIEKVKASVNELEARKIVSKFIEEKAKSEVTELEAIAKSVVAVIKKRKEALYKILEDGIAGKAKPEQYSTVEEVLNDNDDGVIAKKEEIHQMLKILDVIETEAKTIVE